MTSQSDGDIGAGTNVTIVLNNSDVTFDTTATVGAQVINNSVGGGAAESLDSNIVEVNPHNLTINVSTGGNDLEATDVIQIGNGTNNIAFNVTNAPADATVVQVSAETRASADRPVITSDVTNNYITLNHPTTSYTAETENVDNDGETGVSLNDMKVASSVNGDISGGSNVTFKVASGSGVTFDQSAQGTTSASISTGQDGTEAVTGVTVNENNITISLANNDLESTDEITLTNIAANITADATNTTFEVVTNTSDSHVTTAFANQLTINEVTADSIWGDADISLNNTAGDAANNDQFGTTGNQAATENPTVDTTTTGAVYVEDGGSAFGSATVTLEVAETPEGASATLNTTSVTTNSNGIAYFNFTAGTTDGTYIVNATTNQDAGVNITYNVQPGSATDITVMPVENAIAGASGDKGNAALWVNATDEFGNPVSSSTTASLTVDSADAVLAVNDTLTNDGQATGPAPANVDSSLANDGTLTLDDDGTTVVSVTDSVVEDVTIEVEKGSAIDSGTVTFFSNIGQIDVSLNKSTAVVGDTVSANATIKQSDGTTITVPDIQVNFDDNSNTNTTVPASATTNAHGMASVSVTADSAGSSTIDATTNLKKGSAELTILAQESVYEVSNLADETVQYGDDPINISVDVDNTGTIAGSQTIDLSITDAGTEVLSDSVADVQIDAGNSTTVTFVDVDVGSLSAGEYNTTVSSANTSVEGNLTVEKAPLSVDVDPTSVTVNNETDLTVNVTSDGADTALAPNVYSPTKGTVKPELGENAGPCESGIPPGRVYSYTRIHTEGHR